VLDGSLSLGMMLGLSALGAGFLDPVANLVSSALKLAQLKGYMERIEDVLDTPRERNLLSGKSVADAAHAGTLRVEGLNFSYPGEPRPTLEDVSIEIGSGQCVAVVGASGSGKSTLARLLAGLYEPGAGRICFEGEDLRAVNLSSLRERFGIVAQETRLFSGSIRDNVTLFDPAFTQDDVERACRLACLDTAIDAMPMRYDTVLADGGSSLSGGQRQRLALARALIRRPSVLILDEATSALDTVTERAVQYNLRELRCTRVLVAHRLSTIVEADKIIVLESGRLVAAGAHAELVDSSPEYRALLQAQLGDKSVTERGTTKISVPRAVSAVSLVKRPADLTAPIMTYVKGN
jgi:ABC-type bacteriocin/lantibiotic exporter with double-glycine peptidase domain